MVSLVPHETGVNKCLLAADTNQFEFARRHSTQGHGPNLVLGHSSYACKAFTESPERAYHTRPPAAYSGYALGTQALRYVGRQVLLKDRFVARRLGWACLVEGNLELLPHLVSGPTKQASTFIPSGPSAPNATSQNRRGKRREGRRRKRQRAN